MDTLLNRHIWNAGHIPLKHRGQRLAELHEISEPLLAGADRFVTTFPARHLPPSTTQEEFPEDRGLIGVGMTLSGPAGRGKTSVACAIATEVALAYRATVFFIAAPDYLNTYFSRHGALVPEQERSWHQTVHMRANNAALLVLDDMGSEFIANSGSAQKEFSRLLRARFNRALPTLITTNLGPTGWTEAYGPSTGSFLHEAAPLTAMTGPSLRPGE